MKKSVLYLLFLLCLLFLVGCGAEKSGEPKAAQAKIAYTAIDDVGRTLTFTEKPRRIVSLTYGTDEILTDLVDINRIVGYSRWAGDPEISFLTREQAEKVGKKFHTNTEEILSVRPDLVITSVAMSSDAIGAMEELGLKVYISRSPKNYTQMCEKILGIARAVGEEDAGIAMVDAMNKKMAKLEEKLSVIPDDKRKSVAAFNFIAAMGRKGDLIDNMLNMAHIINAVALIPEEYMSGHISKEQVVNVNPDVFLLPTWDYDNKHDMLQYAEQVKNDPAYAGVNAVRNNQLKFVSDRYRYVASHHIVDAVENFAQTIYPELFKGESLK